MPSARSEVLILAHKLFKYFEYKEFVIGDILKIGIKINERDMYHISLFNCIVSRSNCSKLVYKFKKMPASSIDYISQVRIINHLKE